MFRDGKGSKRGDSRLDSKERLDCWAAVEKIVTSASKLIGRGATPGFCSQNIEERLHAQHVAMDFTGSGGRIVSDPKEAAAIAQSGGTHIRSRSSLCAGSRRASSLGPSSSVGSSAEIDEIDEDWFRPKVTREQANRALLPHRNSDGVFLIRDCSRNRAGFVLSFTTGGKVVHAQIIPVCHEGSVVFSLDGGKTKFPTLEQLVEFHKINQGPLPSILSSELPLLTFSQTTPTTCDSTPLATPTPWDSTQRIDILNTPKIVHHSSVATPGSPDLTHPSTLPLTHPSSPRLFHPLTRPSTAPAVLMTHQEEDDNNKYEEEEDDTNNNDDLLSTEVKAMISKIIGSKNDDRRTRQDLIDDGEKTEEKASKGEGEVCQENES